MDSVKVDFSGDKKLKRLLNELPKAPVKRAFRRSINLACTPILKSAKQYCPQETGLLKKSLAKRIKTYSSGVVVGLIGPDRNVVGSKVLGNGKVVSVKPYKYAHLVHDGHAGKHGPTKPIPFLKKAYQDNELRAIATSKFVLKESLEKEAKKLGN